MFHDPTTEDRQGNDAGTQYASAIFTHDDAQRGIAERVKRELQEHITEGRLSCFRESRVSTYIANATVFYPASEEHQAYLDKNPGGYCNHRMRFKEWPASTQD